MKTRLLNLIGSNSPRLVNLISQIDSKDPGCFDDFKEFNDKDLIDTVLKSIVIKDMSNQLGNIKELNAMTPLICQVDNLLHDLAKDYDNIMRLADPNYSGDLYGDFIHSLINKQDVPEACFNTISNSEFKAAVKASVDAHPVRFLDSLFSSSPRKVIDDLQRNANLNDLNPVYQHDVERVIGFRLIDKGRKRLSKQELDLLHALEDKFEPSPSITSTIGNKT